MLLPVINMTWCCRNMCWMVLVKCLVNNGFDNFPWSDDVGGASCTDQEQSCTPAEHQKPGKASDARSGRAGEPVHQSSGKLTPTWIFRQKFAGPCLQTRLCLQLVIWLLCIAVWALHHVLYEPCLCIWREYRIFLKFILNLCYKTSSPRLLQQSIEYLTDLAMECSLSCKFYDFILWLIWNWSHFFGVIPLNSLQIVYF